MKTAVCYAVLVLLLLVPGCLSSEVRAQALQLDLSEQELAWIEENRDIFWLSATVAFEQIGRGVLMVDLISEPQEQGRPFSYYAEGELELQDEELQRFLYDYDPDREFIVVLLKPGGRVGVYRDWQPPIGW